LFRYQWGVVRGRAERKERKIDASHVANRAVLCSEIKASIFCLPPPNWRDTIIKPFWRRSTWQEKQEERKCTEV